MPRIVSNVRSTVAETDYAGPAMDEPEVEQVEGLWVDGQPISFLAAAIVRSAGRGGPPWSLIVANPAPMIAGDDVEVRVLTLAGVTFRSRARHRINKQTKFTTTVLEGTQPLVEVGSQAN